MIGFTRQSQVDERRYSYLKEIVEDYLGDEGTDSAVFIADIKRACAEIRQYHDDRSKHLKAVEGAFNDD